MKKLLAIFTFMFASSLHAAPIEFVPPNDTTGSVFTTNSNDAWSGGRGVVFEATAPYELTSIGLYHDLTGVTLSYTVSETVTASGDVATGETVLASGSQAVTTSGLEWIDFPIPAVALSAGSTYHIEFSFTENGNQNFFYDNANQTFSQAGFDVIDGTNSGNTGNSIMPAIRLGAVAGSAQPVPTLPPLTLLALCLLLLIPAYHGLRRSALMA